MEAQQMMGVVVMLVTFINFYFQEQIRRASPLPEAFFGVLPGGMPVLPSNFRARCPVHSSSMVGRARLAVVGHKVRVRLRLFL